MTVTHASSRPSQRVLREIADLAKIPDPSRDYFSSLIVDAIDFAHEEQNVKQLKLFRKDQIVPLLRRVARDARKVRDLLTRMTARDTKTTPHMVAGNFLRAVLNDQRLNIPAYLSRLDALARAAEAAVTHIRADSGRPPGTSGHAAFDLFVYRLLLAAQRSGGKFIAYKSAHDATGWAGSLLAAVNLLRTSLPQQFLPLTRLGNSLDRIAKQFRADTRKNRGLKI